LRCPQQKEDAIAKDAGQIKRNRRIRMKVAINGFGSIGRRFLRIASERNDIEVVAINDLYDAKTRAHLLKYDSNYGTFDKEVSTSDDTMTVAGKKIAMLSERDVTALPWKALGIDVVLECTGKFTDAEKAKAHIASGAKKVLISAPAKGEDATLVLGVNEGVYDPAAHNIVSMASCTTNCLGPTAKVLSQQFGIKKGFMTTVHAYTNDQVVLDFQHKDIRRSRAAALSIIPTTTGAAKAISLVLPELKGKMNGVAFRVPTPVVSMIDLVCELEKPATIAEINAAYKAEAARIPSILAATDEELVSIDYKGDSHSAIVDLPSTMLLGDNLVKVIAWYDNEWAYSTRLVDMVSFMSKKR
jgi:glyceraldehyde 3-phosphate dehydrogenase